MTLYQILQTIYFKYCILNIKILQNYFEFDALYFYSKSTTKDKGSITPNPPSEHTDDRMGGF